MRWQVHKIVLPAVDRRGCRAVVPIFGSCSYNFSASGPPCVGSSLVWYHRQHRGCICRLYMNPMGCHAVHAAGLPCAVAEVEEERRQKKSLSEALQRVQSRYASLAALPPVPPRPEGSDAVSESGCREASRNCTGAAAAGTPRSAETAKPGFRSTEGAGQPAGTVSRHSSQSSTQPPQGGDQEEGSEDSEGLHEPGVKWEQLRQAYLEAQALNETLQGDVERAQLERDAVLYRWGRGWAAVGSGLLGWVCV